MCRKTLQIYGAGVWAHVGLGSNPFVGEKSLGHIAVNFSCDPDMAWKLVSTLVVKSLG